MTDSSTVFISYRRESSFAYAKLIFNEIRERGYDVFMDYESIDSGIFDTFILNQISSRAHFILILTPDALERCDEPGDWLRREIEQALDTQRNLIPVMVGGFQFKDNEKYLTGKLADLPRYNGLSLVYEYFDAGIEKLCTRFLKLPVQGTLSAVSTTEINLAQQKIEELAAQPKPTEKEITAEDLFFQAVTKQEYGDLEGAAALYTDSIALNPGLYKTHYNRGLIFYEQGRLDQAIEDFNEALRLNPEYTKALHRRGIARYDQKKFALALADLDEAIRLQPDHASFYNNRGAIWQAIGSKDKAIADYQKYLDLGGGKLHGNQQQVEQLIARLQHPAEAKTPTKKSPSSALVMGLILIGVVIAGITLFVAQNLTIAISVLVGIPVLLLLAWWVTSKNGTVSIPSLRNIVGSILITNEDGSTSISPSETMSLNEVENASVVIAPEDGPTAPLPHQPPSMVIGSYDSYTRPLPDITDIMLPESVSGGFFAYQTDVGMTLPRNQDAVQVCFLAGAGEEIEPSCCLLIVADGMSKEAANAKPASLAIKVVTHEIITQVFLSHDSADHDRPTVSEILEQAFQKASQEIISTFPEAGTTLTAALVIGDLAYVAHVGNTRAYLISSDEVEQLTRDHTLVQRLIELEQLNPEDAADHPQRNVLYRLLGQSEVLDVDRLTRRLPAGSYLVLCSDGLWPLVPEKEIREVLLAERDPQQASQKLVSLANLRGGPDNISVIVYRQPG